MFNQEVRKELLGEIGTIIDIKGEICHLLLDNPKLIPRKLGVRNWNENYWTPNFSMIKKVTKLDLILK